MRVKKILAVLALAAFAGACQTIPKEQTVGDYCSNKAHETKDVCKINVEINGQKTALADTNLKLSEARAVADEALAKANATKLTCETRTLRRTRTGTCSPGYTLMGCTQTRYTSNAGGVSILRKIDDSSCRFNDRVLEMQVRCCSAGAVTTVAEAPPAAPAPEKAPAEKPVS